MVIGRSNLLPPRLRGHNHHLDSLTRPKKSVGQLTNSEAVLSAIGANKGFFIKENRKDCPEDRDKAHCSPPRLYNQIYNIVIHI